MCCVINCYVWIRILDETGLREMCDVKTQGRLERTDKPNNQASSLPGPTNMITTPHDGPKSQKAQHSQL